MSTAEEADRRGRGGQMILFGQSTEQSLTFTGTPLSWAVSIAALGLAVALGLMAWRRSGYSGATAGLETLRVTIVAAVALLLNQPEWVEEYRPDRKPTIAVLVDQSPSMETCDVVADSGDGASGASGEASRPARISRSEAARPLTEPATWQRLGERLDVVIEPIGGEREGGTDLASPLLSTAAAVESLLGVVLVSDGDWNAGRPPVEAASRLRMRGIPIFTVATGSPTRLPDLELSSLELPTFATAGKPVRVPFTIESSLPRGVTVKVTMKTSTGASVSKDVRVAAMGPTTDALTFKPTVIGEQTVSIEIPLQDGETIAGQQHEVGTDLDPRRKTAGLGGRVVSAVGVSVPSQRALARPWH